MSSRRDHLASQERRIRRLLGRMNIDLLKPLKPDAKVLAHGGYKLRDAATGNIVFGETPYPFSKTLEEIEAWIEAAEER
ncbi:MAG: hypothetical protein ABL866_05590 [Devosia sp.]